MQSALLHDKVEIEAYLREDVDLHLYSIGDLDDFFWPHTSWFAAKSGSDLRAVALLYTGLSLSTLLALPNLQTEPYHLKRQTAEFR